MRNVDDLTIKGWWLQGKYFGYPNCCIEAFIKDKQQQNSVFLGTGFLPCQKCNKQTPKVLIEKINTNRVCPSLFTLGASSVVFGSEDWNELKREASLLWKAAENLGDVCLEYSH